MRLHPTTTRPTFAPLSGYHGLLTAALALTRHRVCETPPPDLAKLLAGKSLSELTKLHPDLQSEVDKVIAARLARAKPEPDATTEQERQELAALRKKEKDRETADLEDKKRYDALIANKDKEYGEQLSAKDNEVKTLMTEIEKERVDNALLAAAAAAQAVDASVVAAVLKPRLRLNSKTRQVEVLDEHGDPMIVKGKPATIAQLIEADKLVHKNLYTAEGDPDKGSGGGGSSGEGDPKDLDLDQQIEKAEKVHKAAREAYATSPTEGNLTVARKAARAVQELKDKKKKAAK